MDKHALVWSPEVSQFDVQYPVLEGGLMVHEKQKQTIVTVAEQSLGKLQDPLKNLQPEGVGDTQLRCYCYGPSF